MIYTLVVIDDDGSCLNIPMNLNGSETQDQAIERFKDALTIARHEYAKRWGVEAPLAIYKDTDGKIINRIDGRDE